VKRIRNLSNIINYSIDISVYITVRNEAHRIEACLKRLSWVKEIFIFDKESSDNTVNICQNNGATVINVPNTPKNDKGIELFSKLGSGKWCLFLTASDLVGEKLKFIIANAIKKPEIKAISVPYLTYNFGNYVPINPFSRNTKVLLLRRDSVKLSTTVHMEIGYSEKKVYKIQQPRISDHESYIVHLANENFQEYFNKFPRYLQKEALSKDNYKVRIHIINLIKDIFNALLLRPSYVFGIRGLLYTTSYLSYVLSRFTLLTANKHRIDHPHLYKSYEDIRRNRNLNN
tara:strand:+ start:508 stop:1368 length:861 start_codon:yes stop_codon:yes gene_type:complete